MCHISVNPFKVNVHTPRAVSPDLTVAATTATTDKRITISLIFIIFNLSANPFFQFVLFLSNSRKFHFREKKRASLLESTAALNVNVWRNMLNIRAVDHDGYKIILCSSMHKDLIFSDDDDDDDDD